jgi:isopenicillin N synthase-like dioxygenase
MSRLIHELRRDGLVNVDYPEDLRGIVENAVLSWKAFCNLSKEDKCTFAFQEDHHDGAGYELKEEKQAKRDLKENFHVTQFQYARLAKIANQRTFPFLHDANILLDKIEPVVLQFARDVEKEYGVEGLTQEVKISKPYWILRYLHYFGDQQLGSEIAAPHADKGGFTLHLYESDEGLQYYCIKMRTWNPMPVCHKQTVIIPAMQLQLRSEGKLKALYHRVVATEQTARHGRFSMVCFIPFENTAKYHKKMYGNMQSHDVGFNYDMPHEKFVNLFYFS